MTAPLLIALALLAGAPAPLPEDPVERVCAKALSGSFGPLKPWQKQGYQALAKGHKRMTAVRSHYGPYEGRQGRVDAYGNPCTMRTLASNRLPRRSWVLLMAPHWELRQVLDCGATWNDGHWLNRPEGRGCDLWADRWHPSPRLKDEVGPVQIAVAR